MKSKIAFLKKISLSVLVLLLTKTEKLSAAAAVTTISSSCENDVIFTAVDSSATSYFDAEAQCEALGQTLAAVRSALQFTQLSTLAGSAPVEAFTNRTISFPSLWIGIRDITPNTQIEANFTNRFSFEDGTAEGITFIRGSAGASPWGISQPDDNGGSQNCVRLVFLPAIFGGGFRFDDENCERAGLNLICAKSCAPTNAPTTATPTEAPTKFPTETPTRFPSNLPTKNPTRSPTVHPSQNPTGRTGFPTSSPSKESEEFISETPQFPVIALALILVVAGAAMFISLLMIRKEMKTIEEMKKAVNDLDASININIGSDLGL